MASSVNGEWAKDGPVGAGSGRRQPTWVPKQVDVDRVGRNPTQHDQRPDVVRITWHEHENPQLETYQWKRQGEPGQGEYVRKCIQTRQSSLPSERRQVLR